MQGPYTTRFPLSTEPRPRYERCEEQIVMVLTFCAKVNHRSTRQESGLLYSSHLGIAGVTCATLYLYYMVVVELSLWTEFCLFDQRNTSAAHQLTSDLNKQQTSTLFSSRKSVTEERISIKYIRNLIKQFAKIDGRPK